MWEDVIPAFGATVDLLGKCLVFLFGFGISLMMTVILGGILARYYGGNLTRRAINFLVWGRALSLVAKGVVVFFAFNLLVFLLSPRNVFLFCEVARGFIGDPAWLYSGVMAMKEPLRKSAATQLALSPALSLIPFITLRFFGRG